jgi:hypothetical protein
MRIRRLVAAAALVALATAAVAVPADTVTAAGAATPAGGAARGRHRSHCLLPLPGAGAPVGNAGKVGESTGPAPVTHPPAPPSGDLEVTIPPVVLIREVNHSGSRHLWITTNTGVPPQPEDGFWVLGIRRATPADAALRADVLAGCVSWSHI